MNSQAGAQALNAMSQVNEREAAKAYETDKYNQQMHNQYKSNNITKDDNYDTLDAMGRAAVQKYEDQAYSEASVMAQRDEQKRYMMARNKKQDDVQAATWGLMGTAEHDLYVDENGQYKVRFKNPNGYSKGVEDGYTKNDNNTFTDRAGVKYNRGRRTWNK